MEKLGSIPRSPGKSTDNYGTKRNRIGAGGKGKADSWEQSLEQLVQVVLLTPSLLPSLERRRGGSRIVKEKKLTIFNQEKCISIPYLKTHIYTFHIP